MREYIQKYTDDPNWMNKIVIIHDNLLDSLDGNTDKLVEALNQNSKSADFLAKVGIFIGIVGVFATTVGTIFGILSYLK